MASDDNSSDAPRPSRAAMTTAGTGILSSSTTGVEIGTQIMGTFEIVEHIATGGMGEVYRGLNVHTREPVAIKIVLAALAHDEKILSMFQKEATVLGRLHHDAIVRYQLFTIDPHIRRACLVMEFVEGRPLSDYITDGPVPLADVVVMASHLTSGLQKAHDLGVVHRDLSPDNVIVTDGDMGHVKIIDFGIAKSANFGGGTLLEGQFAGKFNYVSPEQLGRFRGQITASSDIYSLALVLAAACMGRVLDMGETPADAVEKRFTVPDLSGVYPEIQPVLSHMLAPDPADRPADMATVQAMLASVPVSSAGVPGTAPSDTVVPPPGQSLPPTFHPPGTSAPQATVLSTPPTTGFPTGSAGATVVSQPPSFDQAAAPPAATVMSTPPQARAATPPVGARTEIAAQSSDVDSPFGAAAPQPAPAAAEPVAPPAAPEKKRSPAVLILLAVLAAAVGAGAWFGGTMLGDRDPEADPVAAVDPPAPSPQQQPTPDPVPAPDQVAVADPVPERAAPPTPDSQPAPVPQSAPEPDPTPAPDPTPVDRAAPPLETPPDQNEAVASIADEVVALADQAGVDTTAPAAAPEPAPARVLSPDAAWLSEFTLPGCAYARPSGEIAGVFGIEAFGTDVEPIIALDAAFKTERGKEADIGFRQITSSQCNVLGFLQGVATEGPNAPDLQLTSDVLRTGTTEPLQGTIVGVDGRSTWLLMVDDTGGAYDISELLTSNGAPGEQQFSLAVNARSEAQSATLRPLLLIAISSTVPIEGIAFTQGEPVQSVLDQVRARFATATAPLTADVGYVRLEDG